MTSKRPLERFEPRRSAASVKWRMLAASALAAAATWLMYAWPGASPPQSQAVSPMSSPPGPPVDSGRGFDSRVSTTRKPRPAANARPRDNEITPEDLEHALAAAEPGRRDLILEQMLSALALRNAPAAARFAELEREPYLREVALRTVAQRWSQIEPDAAADWASSLPDAEERDTAIANVALAIAPADPPRALTMLERRTSADAPDAALEGVVTQWAETDFPAARSWSEAQPDGASRDRLLERLVYLRSTTDPADAAELARLISADATRFDALASIVPGWMSRDSAALHAWADTLDQGARRRVTAELSIFESHLAPPR